MPAPKKQETIIKQNPSSAAHDDFYANPQLDDTAAIANGLGGGTVAPKPTVAPVGEVEVETPKPKVTRKTTRTTRSKRTT